MDLYNILGISRSASEDEIKKSYKSLAKKFHPDNQDTGNSDKFKQVQEAFDILGDTDKKSKYDKGIPLVKQKQNNQTTTTHQMLPVLRYEIFDADVRIAGFTKGKRYAILSDNGNYRVVNDFGKIVGMAVWYFCAEIPGLDKVFSPSKNDLKVKYTGAPITDAEIEQWRKNRMI